MKRQQEAEARRREEAFLEYVRTTSDYGVASLLHANIHYGAKGELEPHAQICAARGESVVVFSFFIKNIFTLLLGKPKRLKAEIFFCLEKILPLSVL